MATLNAQVQALLLPLAAGGVHYQINEAPTPTYPYIVWTTAGGLPNVTLTGRAKLQEARLQVDIFDTQLARLLATDAALDALVDAGLEAEPGSTALRLVPISEPQDLFEEAVRAHRRLREFTLHWTRD